MTLFQKMKIITNVINDNIYEKSGYNDNLDYFYFLLDDITPAIRKACDAIGIFCHDYIT